MRKQLLISKPYLFAEIDKKKAKIESKGIKIYDLGVGDPDLLPPTNIIENLIQALQIQGVHNYPSYEGESSTRQKVIQYYKNRFNVNLSQDEVIISIGSKEAIAHFLFAFLNEGDTILLPSIGYPVYENFAQLIGANIIKAPINEETNFLIEPKLIEEYKPKLLVLNYPNNPTSKVANIEYLNKIADTCRKIGTKIAFDNAYAEIYYEDVIEKVPSILEVAKDISIEFMSFSKMFNITGWRIGFVAGNKELVQALLKVKKNVDSGVPKFIQFAAEVALEDLSFTKNLRNIYTNRKKLFLENLATKPEKVIAEGTFFLWLKYPMNSLQLADRLLDKGVVVTPGIGFGQEAENWIRVSLTSSDETIKNAAKLFEL